MRRWMTQILDLLQEASEGEGRGAVIQLAIVGVVILALCVFGIYILVTGS